MYRIPVRPAPPQLRPPAGTHTTAGSPRSARQGAVAEGGGPVRQSRERGSLSCGLAIRRPRPALSLSSVTCEGEKTLKTRSVTNKRSP